jgi:hypothetical protein
MMKEETNGEMELVVLVQGLERGDVVHRGFDEEGEFLQGRVRGQLAVEMKR